MAVLFDDCSASAGHTIPARLEPGRRAALNELLLILYGELRRLARSYMARERQGQLL
jgi:hypothetical protein